MQHLERTGDGPLLAGRELLELRKERGVAGVRGRLLRHRQHALRVFRDVSVQTGQVSPAVAVGHLRLELRYPALVHEDVVVLAPDCVHAAARLLDASLHLLELGSLDDAVKKAAELANLSDYHQTSYPQAATWYEQLLASENSRGTYIDSELRELLGDFYKPLLNARRDTQRNRLQVRYPYTISFN